MRPIRFVLALLSAAALQAADAPAWPQWRGPARDGQVTGAAWPERLDEAALERRWRVPLGPSYSGPIIADDLVFTTQTVDKESEMVLALDRASGAERWRVAWKGAMSVPFFAASGGSWIRSTPAYDGQRLYVAGMRDLIVCLDAQTGAEVWRVDAMERGKAPLPAFGCVCSPLVDGDALYIQAGGGVLRLDKASGATVWRSLADGGGMNGSAFSSPIIAELAGTRQLVVQTREKLAGLDLASGATLWEQPIPAFRGMNILTPLVVGDTVFTSSYQNSSWLYRIERQGGSFRAVELWKTKIPAYMSSPVAVGGRIYMHLQNQRLACLDAVTGASAWTSVPFGKYMSLVAQGDRILGLDASGRLLLYKADAQAFTALGEVKVSASETWAHLAVSGEDIAIRELDGLSLHRWKRAP
jgi:outer membrane protein assembly factor BamB